MTTDLLSPWLDVTSTTEYTGYHAVTIRTALEHGQLHGHQRRFRGRWRIHINAINAWLSGENSATACGCSQLAPRSRSRAS